MRPPRPIAEAGLAFWGYEADGALVGIMGIQPVHGFELASAERKAELLETYWTIPDRQIEISVVLANPPLGESG